MYKHTRVEGLVLYKHQGGGVSFRLAHKGEEVSYVWHTRVERVVIYRYIKVHGVVM